MLSTKLAVFLLSFLLLAALVSGCNNPPVVATPEVWGQFDGVPYSAGMAQNGDRIHAEKGAEIYCFGIADVRSVSVAETKSCCAATTGGVIVGAIVVTAGIVDWLVNDLSMPQDKTPAVGSPAVEIKIPPTDQDLLVTVGVDSPKAISFTLLMNEGGGEGEGEGEGEGQQYVTVPDLTGDNLSQASVELSNVGLSVGQVTTVNSVTVPIGIIADWSPRGSVPVSTTINIVVSTGPGGAVVPNLSGLTQAEAVDAISQTCLSVGLITTTPSDTVAVGFVVSWSPMGTVACGTAINLVISSGPNSVAMSVKITSPASGSVFRVGDQVSVSVLPKGTPASGYRLLISAAGKKDMEFLAKGLISMKVLIKSLPSVEFKNAVMGQTYTANFDLNLMGQAFFLAYLEDANGNYFTDSASYSVLSP